MVSLTLVVYGEACRHGLAWLGSVGMPYLYSFTPQGALEDQIRLDSHIRVILIVG